MRFFVDQCAGSRVAEWLRNAGHDVFEGRELLPDPGDRELLRLAAAESRVVITIDTDFGTLIFSEGEPHSGLIRLPDVPSDQRIELMKDLIERYSLEIGSGAIITVRGGRIRVSHVPSPDAALDEEDAAPDEAGEVNT